MQNHSKGSEEAYDKKMQLTCTFGADITETDGEEILGRGGRNC